MFSFGKNISFNKNSYMKKTKTFDEKLESPCNSCERLWLVVEVCYLFPPELDAFSNLFASLEISGNDKI